MANIIKQLKDSNGNNIYPIAYAQGGVKMDLLWENPSITSDFSAQTVSLDLSKYNLLYVKWRTSKDATAYTDIICAIDGLPRVVLTRNGSQTGQYGLSWRAFTPSSSSVEFEAGHQQTAFSNQTGTENNRLIPYQIYGIKMSYIVPTVVNGLQYVEV